MSRMWLRSRRKLRAATVSVLWNRLQPIMPTIMKRKYGMPFGACTLKTPPPKMSE